MSGESGAKTPQVPGPAIILVEPQLGENIGMVARAMANFGLSDLRLVAPRDGWPNEKARAAASRADHVIDAVRVYDNVADAVAELRFVLATTARTREIPKEVLGPREAAAALREHESLGQETGLLFGRERWGLVNEEIAYADKIVTFPVNPSFASLNLAQSVLLMSYEWLQSGLGEGELPTRAGLPELDEMPAPKAELVGLMEHLESALEPTGYYRTEEKRPVMVRNLRAMLQRPGFTTTEIRALRGVVAALEGRKTKRDIARAAGEEDE
ncbi:RNA methyltransferase [Afifella aestuarii]|uniref:RNA methyltransferase n=1 Tax=Afifella aestuarii TaxID=1909496 RepID=UPI00248225A3|nr:RNA methyltransferase [Afifella aestuarii]